MEKMMQIFYDKLGDVLFLTVGDPRPAVSEEAGDDILLRVDEKTGEVVGITILNFSSRFSSLQAPHQVPVMAEFKAVLADEPSP